MSSKKKKKTKKDESDYSDEDETGRNMNKKIDDNLSDSDDDVKSVGSNVSNYDSDDSDDSEKQTSKQRKLKNSKKKETEINIEGVDLDGVLKNFSFELPPRIKNVEGLKKTLASILEIRYNGVDIIYRNKYLDNDTKISELNLSQPLKFLINHRLAKANKNIDSKMDLNKKSNPETKSTKDQYNIKVSKNKKENNIEEKININNIINAVKLNPQIMLKILNDFYDKDKSYRLLYTPTIINEIYSSRSLLYTFFEKIVKEYEDIIINNIPNINKINTKKTKKESNEIDQDNMRTIREIVGNVYTDEDIRRAYIRNRKNIEQTTTYLLDEY